MMPPSPNQPVPMNSPADLFELLDESPRLESQLALKIRDCTLSLLDQRYGSSTICPSEVAREVAQQIGCEWRDLMRSVRYVAGVLAEAGQVEVLQEGVAVDIGDARGPIRLRLRRPNLT
jgi:Protein of unknown function (DUF3253)